MISMKGGVKGFCICLSLGAAWFCVFDAALLFCYRHRFFHFIDLSLRSLRSCTSVVEGDVIFGSLLQLLDSKVK